MLDVEKIESATIRLHLPKAQKSWFAIPLRAHASQKGGWIAPVDTNKNVLSNSGTFLTFSVAE